MHITRPQPIPRDQPADANGKTLGRDKNSDLQRLGELILHQKPRVIAIAATDMDARRFREDIEVLGVNTVNQQRVLIII